MKLNFRAEQGSVERDFTSLEKTIIKKHMLEKEHNYSSEKKEL